MTKPHYKLNEIDNLFFDLFGFYPAKEGQSYEKIVGAALKIIYSDNQIIWDERKKGIYDKNTYQIDVGLYSIEGDNFMVEAKDHSKDNKKVSRPELDKIAGSLIELDYNSGLFFSSTDYTRDAKKKSKGSQINPNAKKISLYHLRTSKDEDKKGRIGVFKLKIVTFEIDEKNTSFTPSIPDSAFENYKQLEIPSNLKSSTLFYYNETSIHCKGLLHDDNNAYIGEYEFFKTLDKSVYQQAKDNNLTISGTWKVDSGHLHVKNLQTQIDQVQYKITFKEISTNFEVKPKGKPVLLIASEDGEINKLLTDHQLKGITFSSNGEVLFDGREP